MSEPLYANTVPESAVPEAKPDDEKLTMNYVLEQIERIATQTGYLDAALQKLGEMEDGENAESCSPGNLQGKAKAEAIGSIVQSREETNQRLLSLYTMMYVDLKPKAKPQEKAEEDGEASPV
ncbi:MAG TPA: hypothetical protein VN540_10140 [Clostridia bacterium]|nr:hypothetical protein [Clostridia bacterium]